ncbi:Ltp family lipoprotein [Caryophanon tenue]|uniref:Putative host cell surface-exposed lipoprotein Ltp-like HTH region domain-containing protein n=1 Tax=Caryophanon tenue TaxID=33978 RepID=A0A1C0YE05_9BACL|nr:Ltp family lipoprotein [Caryophanon tenue]OCS85408.1 hypothetical protein A6M13_13295 [Caryophanon tenue]
MVALLSLLTVVFFILFVVGLVSPSSVFFRASARGEHTTKKEVFRFFGIPFLLSAILLVWLMPTSETTTDAVVEPVLSTETEVQEEVAAVPEEAQAQIEAEEQAKKDEQARIEAEEQAKKDEQARIEAEKQAAGTMEQQQAVRTAESYLNYSAFSRSGLIEQLMYEGFSETDSAFAVDAHNVDWQQQANKMAQSYIDYSAFSPSGLIDQLVYEGFNEQQATNAVNQLSVDWVQQAVLMAESYLEYSSFSRSGLIDQLIYECFSEADASYAATQAGL